MATTFTLTYVVAETGEVRTFGTYPTIEAARTACHAAIRSGFCVRIRDGGDASAVTGWVIEMTDPSDTTPHDRTASSMTTLFCIEALHRGNWALRSETFTSGDAAEAWVARTFGDARRAVRIVEVVKKPAFYTIVDANAPHHTKAVVEADTRAEALGYGLRRFGHVLVHETAPDLVPSFARG